MEDPDEVRQRAAGHAQASGFSYQDPMVRKGLHKPRSMFYPGHRLRMNLLPMFICLWIPWGDSVILMGVIGFKLMYKNPIMAWCIVAALVIFWLFLVFNAFRQRKNNPDPTWYTFLALVVGIATVFGIVKGWFIYHAYTLPYFQVGELSVATNFDLSGGSLGGLSGSLGVGPGMRGRAAGITKTNIGVSLMDVGVLQFSPGTHIDVQKSWHFKWKKTYCVAPVVGPDGGAPPSKSYDIWMVGKGCCSVNEADYRCGPKNPPPLLTGVRVTDDEDLKYYHLAVNQAESTFGIAARHPIFFYQAGRNNGGTSSGTSNTQQGGSASSSYSPGYGGGGVNASGGGSANAPTAPGVSGGAGASASGFGWGGNSGLRDASTGIEAMRARGNREFFFWAVWLFIFFLFAVCMASCSYSWLGRNSGKGATEYVNDPGWNEAAAYGGQDRPLDYRTMQG